MSVIRVVVSPGLALASPSLLHPHSSRIPLSLLFPRPPCACDDAHNISRKHKHKHLSSSLHLTLL